MPIELTFNLSPQQASSAESILQQVSRKLGKHPSAIGDVHVVRKSIDARRGKVRVNVGVKVYAKGGVCNRYHPQVFISGCKE